MEEETVLRIVYRSIEGKVILIEKGDDAKIIFQAIYNAVYEKHDLVMYTLRGHWHGLNIKDISTFEMVGGGDL